MVNVTNKVWIFSVFLVDFLSIVQKQTVDIIEHFVFGIQQSDLRHMVTLHQKAYGHLKQKV